ncbi:MAG: hypothetical protein ACJ790_09200 [Myxococcaceae bacterium]
MSRRKAVLIALLVVQLLLIARAQLSDDRYFGWAPFHSHARYRVEVSIDGRELSPAEVRARYQLPGYHVAANGWGWELNDPRHLVQWIRQYEESYGKSDHARVRLTLRPLEGAEQVAWEQDR